MSDSGSISSNDSMWDITECPRLEKRHLKLVARLRFNEQRYYFARGNTWKRDRLRHKINMIKDKIIRNNKDRREYYYSHYPSEEDSDEPPRILFKPWLREPF